MYSIATYKCSMKQLRNEKFIAKTLTLYLFSWVMSQEKLKKKWKNNIFQFFYIFVIYKNGFMYVYNFIIHDYVKHTIAGHETQTYWKKRKNCKIAYGLHYSIPLVSVDGGKIPSQQGGWLPILKAPIRLEIFWGGRCDEIVDPLRF